MVMEGDTVFRRGSLLGSACLKNLPKPVKAGKKPFSF